jgi:Copper amine oxidase, enzyme domain
LLARSPSTEVTIGIPVPKHSQDFDPASVGALREAPKPLCHVQPDGPSWVRDGNLVRWQNWSFRFTLHPREGLVLHTVSWDDHGRARPVLYRSFESVAKSYAARLVIDIPNLSSSLYRMPHSPTEQHQPIQGLH